MDFEAGREISKSLKKSRTFGAFFLEVKISRREISKILAVLLERGWESRESAKTNAEPVFKCGA